MEFDSQNRDNTFLSLQRQRSARVQAHKKQQRKVLLITVICLLIILLAGMGLLVASLFSPAVQDDGRIGNNIYLLDMDLSGKTPQQLRQDLQQRVVPKLQKTLAVQLPDTKLEFPQEKTKVSLDMDALVQAAYNLGRTQSYSGKVTLNLLDYLQLDTDYIKLVLAGQNALVQSTLTQPTFQIEGQRPALPENPETDPVQHQTLVITLGKAERHLDTEALYNRILNAYNTLDLTPIATEYYQELPASPDLGQAWLTYCQEPENASLNPSTFEITDEVWGYGFDIQVATVAVNNASEGAVVRIPMEFLAPSVTRESLENGLFQDTLASVTLAYPNHIAKTNAILDAKRLSGTIVLPQQSFSFNDALGSRDPGDGYAPGDGEIDGYMPSALYQAALLAELTVTQRTAHTCAPTFTQPGLDAVANLGSTDLCLRNDSAYPVRILVKAGSQGITVTVQGTDKRGYTTSLDCQTTHIDKYATLLVPAPNEPKEDGTPYVSGDVVREGINGLTVESQLLRQDKATGQLSRILIATQEYTRQDKYIVQ